MAVSVAVRPHEEAVRAVQANKSAGYETVVEAETSSQGTCGASEDFEVGVDKSIHFDNLVTALKSAATSTNGGITAYSADNTTRQLSYNELLRTAQTNAARLQHRVSKPLASTVVLLHFEDTLDSIVWYWTVLLAGGIPVTTGPSMLSQDSAERVKHLEHLRKTLKGPLCITRHSLAQPFTELATDQRIDTHAVEDIIKEPYTSLTPISQMKASPSALAAIMLTSGSSGNAKAVPLSHFQILAALRGKIEGASRENPGRPYMSWVFMDHVANLIHIHLAAVVAGVSQIQVTPSAVIIDPLNFLNLLSRHRVFRSFAPHFLLAKLLKQLQSGDNSGQLDADLNLDGLLLDTGGEANVTKVCTKLCKLLSQYGAPADVLRPSFGMTETCAGCTVNPHFPSYEDSHGHEFASLGHCTTGTSMRVTKLVGSGLADPGERGNLELCGETVFKGYYNNEAENAKVFYDGWFRTGDLAYLDDRGYLFLDGRTKEMININGVKYLPYELDAALEKAHIPGTTPSYFCTFGSRDASMSTEVVVVLYLPSYEEYDDAARFEAQSAIMRIVGLHTQSRPRVLPLRQENMPKSSLGKLSRSKLQTALESGQFTALEETNDVAIKRHRQSQPLDLPATPEEVLVLQVVRQQLAIRDDDGFSVADSLLSTGATSMDLVGIMHHLNRRSRKVSPDYKHIRLTDILLHPTARGLAALLSPAKPKTVEEHEYDPVVVLQPQGIKTPLWLVHPGVGEVLVFVSLAHHIVDRPVYAFRAKGFNSEYGETPFKSLEEVFETYHAAIKKRQPQGPYAVGGYSFGGMVAFEIAKRLESNGDEVSYCGSWNLPPHIKWRMRELLWDECVIHLFYFVGLITEADAYTHKETLCALDKSGRRLEAIKYLRKHCDAARWDELGLSEEYYLLWVGLASNMQGLAVDYEPSGEVTSMDVMVADPLSHVAKDRNDWIRNRLSAWKEFVRDEDVQFHHVQGAHYTMLNREYVIGFAETLKKVLAQRGL